MWLAEARYEDGTEVRKEFVYNEDGNYYRECDREYELEAWLIGLHDGCIWYSVVYTEDI